LVLASPASDNATGVLKLLWSRMHTRFCRIDCHLPAARRHGNYGRRTLLWLKIELSATAPEYESDRAAFGHQLRCMPRR
jgi:hypothetical protein